MSSINAITARHVLLVDDNETDNFIHKRIIELTGFADEVIAKESVKKAIDYLEQNINDSEKLPDIIFLDINMPGADGFIFLNKYEELITSGFRKKAKIIILSSSESTRDISRMISNSLVKEYINKLLTEESLEKVKLDLKR